MEFLVRIAIPEHSEEHRPPTPEERVRDLLECIESGHDSRVEWLELRKFYRALSSIPKPSERAVRLMREMEPTLARYGYPVRTPSRKADK